MSLINEVCPHTFSIFFSIFDLGIWEGGGLMRNMCLLGRVLPNYFSPWNKFENCKQWGTSIVQSTIMTMLDTTQYYMALYFYNEYMYGAFDTSLLKHSYCNCGSLWILNCSIKYSYSYSYFCHVFTRVSAVTLFHNKTIQD